MGTEKRQAGQGNCKLCRLWCLYQDSTAAIPAGKGGLNTYRYYFKPQFNTINYNSNLRVIGDVNFIIRFKLVYIFITRSYWFMED